MAARTFLDIEDRQTYLVVPPGESQSPAPRSAGRRGLLWAGALLAAALVLAVTTHPAASRVITRGGDLVGLVGASPEASWSRHTDTFLNLYAGGLSDVMPLNLAKDKCIELGSACYGVTCGHDAAFGTGESSQENPEESCTVRRGECSAHGLYGCPEGKHHGLQESPSHEVSYVKHDAKQPIGVEGIGRPLGYQELPVSTAPSGAVPEISWSRHTDTFLNLYAGAVSDVMPLSLAKDKCIELGSACYGLTCGHDAAFGTGEASQENPEESCTVRQGECSAHGLYGCPEGKRHGLQESPTHEVSYVKHGGRQPIEVEGIGRARSKADIPVSAGALAFHRFDVQ